MVLLSKTTGAVTRSVIIVWFTTTLRTFSNHTPNDVPLFSPRHWQLTDTNFVVCRMVIHAPPATIRAGSKLDADSTNGSEAVPVPPTTPWAASDPHQS